MVRMMDLVLVNAALLLSCQLYYDMHAPQNHLDHVMNTVPVVSLLCLISFSVFGLYRVIWKFASVDALVQIGVSALVGSFATYLFSFISYSISPDPNVFLMPRPIYLFCWLLVMLFIGGTRFLSRIAYKVRYGGGLLAIKKGKRLMIIGAGWEGSSVIRDAQAGRYGQCHVVLILDDDPRVKGTRLMNVPVITGTDKINERVHEYRIDEIIIAVKAKGDAFKKIIEACSATGCRTRMVNTLMDIKTGQTAIGGVRDIQIGDLIGREEKHLDMSQVSFMFSGRRVMITGGGGSIGSELCRQIKRFGPSKIILYDISENYMYDLSCELHLTYGTLLSDSLELCVGSVTDPKRLDEVFTLHKPDIVIHAAAHKHVPLMENCPSQAVWNNIFGTYEVAQAAARHQSSRFVMISTDKAVNPSSVMGVTKRMAEMLITALQDRGFYTQFTAVRFGNVLGSHGSVVPIFEKQIRKGGPVTLTHPEIERYFMTIPEAASLVLQAASIARGGELFVLDMGSPVKIKTLAERMIDLYQDPGLPPVQIEYTGLRPGEKLYEELITDKEGITRTNVDKVFVTKPEYYEWQIIERKLNELRDCIEKGGDMRACLHSIIPSYLEQTKDNSTVNA